MKKMLIDATDPSETRLAIVENNQLENYELELRPSKYTKGNVYLAKVVRVEPALQAAFVEYADNVQGFLPFSEIHPDYFNIPVDDYEALMAEQRAERQALADAVEADEQGDQEDSGQEESGDNQAEVLAEAESSEDGSDNKTAESPTSIDDGVDFETSRGVVFTPKIIKRYKIQEVVKRGQLMLVQVTKEERGNKRAALSSYIALAGCYCVLIPNALFNGGVSRKIETSKERKRLKKMMATLEVPEGMAMILRTAAEGKTKASVSRDLKYLLKLWDELRSRTLDSVAPLMIHEEADLINRSLRDIFSKQIEEVHIAGVDAYAEAKKFTKQINPKLSKSIIEHEEAESKSLFEKFGLESELLKLLNTEVVLSSGGALVIEQTEALVSIDINSSKAIGERNIEETAVKINLEAAKEIARQLRLRDLAGLVVIDFIDMERRGNQQKVERALKQALKSDKARIHIGRISNFGLLEMSRQRLGLSILEKTTNVCSHCHGRGRILNPDTVTTSLIRALRVRLAEGNIREGVLKVHALSAIVESVLNNHLQEVAALEKEFEVKLQFVVNTDLKNSFGWDIDPQDRGNRHRRKERNDRSSKRGRQHKPRREASSVEENPDTTDEVKEDAGHEENTDSSQEPRKDTRRRKRRSGRSGRNELKDSGQKDEATTEKANSQDSSTENSEKAPEAPSVTAPEAPSDTAPETAPEDTLATEKTDKKARKPRQSRRSRTENKENQENQDATPDAKKTKTALKSNAETLAQESANNDQSTAVEVKVVRGKPNPEVAGEIKPKRRGWWNNLISS